MCSLACKLFSPTLDKSRGVRHSQKSVQDFEISGFHGRFWDFSEDFKTSLEISRFQLGFRDFNRDFEISIEISIDISGFPRFLVHGMV